MHKVGCALICYKLSLAAYNVDVEGFYDANNEN